MQITVAQTDRFILKHKRYERETGCGSWEPLGLLQRHRTVRVREEQLQKLPHFTLDLSFVNEFAETHADFLPRRSHFNQRTRGQDLGVHTGRFASDWRRCWVLDYIWTCWPATTTIRCCRSLQLEYQNCKRERKPVSALIGWRAHNKSRSKHIPGSSKVCWTDGWC